MPCILNDLCPEQCLYQHILRGNSKRFLNVVQKDWIFPDCSCNVNHFLDGGYIAVAFSDLIIMNMLIAGTQGS